MKKIRITYYLLTLILVQIKELYFLVIHVAKYDPASSLLLLVSELQLTYLGSVKPAHQDIIIRALRMQLEPVMLLSSLQIEQDKCLRLYCEREITCTRCV